MYRRRCWCWCGIASMHISMLRWNIVVLVRRRRRRSVHSLFNLKGILGRRSSYLLVIRAEVLLIFWAEVLLIAQAEVLPLVERRVCRLRRPRSPCRWPLVLLLRREERSHGVNNHAKQKRMSDREERV
jgi:hypothetical protein